MFHSKKIRDLRDFGGRGRGRSFTTVVTVTLNTFRRIGDDIEYSLDVCRTATWLPTYRFIKK